MRIILSELQIKKIVNEVLKDEIPSYMSDIIQKRYGNAPNILNKEIPKHTDKIPNLKVEITNKNLTNSVNNDLVKHFTQNILKQFQDTELYKSQKNIPIFDLIKKSLGVNVSLDYRDMEFTDVKETDADYVKSIAWLYTKEFKLPTPESIDINNPIFSKNKSSFATFLKVSKKIFPELAEDIVRYEDVVADYTRNSKWDYIMDGIINDRVFVGLRQPIVNYLDNVKKLQTAKLYLYISDKPDDKLRMSISRYYDSCQNLYSGGDEGTTHNKKLLSNVFDVNSKVAYLIYDAPFTDNRGNEHPFTSVARTIIRVNEGGGIMFDRVYPGKMENEFYQIIEDATGLKNEGKDGDIYHYSEITGLPTPYMDKYNLVRKGGQVDDEKIKALINQYKLKADNYEFTYGGDEDTIVVRYIYGVDSTYYYKVISNYDMEEKCRDYVLNRISDYEQFEDKTITDLIDMGLVNWDSVTKLIEKVDNKFFNSTYYHSSEEFLDGYLKDVYKIENLYDFEELVNSRGIDMPTWYFQNIDLNKVIKILGGFLEIASHFTKGDIKFYKTSRSGGEGYYMYEFDI
jgi:hypothetical protein